MNISAKMREPEMLCAFLNGNNLFNSSSIYQLMRIGIILLIISITTLSVLMASSVKGQDITSEKVSIDLNDKNIISAIRQIEQQTSFRFYYRKRDLDGIKVSDLHFKLRTIEETLTELLKSTPLSFKQVENSILLEKKILQDNYQLKGKIIGSNLHPADHATVTIRKMNIEQILQSTLTDTSGYFEFNLTEKGNYLLNISVAGQDKRTVSLSLNDRKITELEDIILSDDISNLKEVIVVGKKPYIEQKMDRTVINVNSLISNDGANALEVLEKSPGVIVDGKGNISFKGKPGVTIFIDGKPTYLSGENLAGYLKSMPASLLEQIELIDNPPAKYDAAGAAGVINIKTKKLKANGFNGSLSANYGIARYSQTTESLNLNYRVNKVNIFSSASYSISQGYRTLDEKRDYFDSNGILENAFEQKFATSSKNRPANLKVGMDYYASPNTTWGIVMTGSITPKSDHTLINNELLDQNRTLNSVILANNSSKGHFNNGGVNINYSHQFDNSGKVITFDLDGLTYSAINNQTFFNQTFNPAGKLTDTQIITDNLPTNINIYSAKTDYVYPLKGKAKLEAGLKTSYIHTDNEANYFNVADGISTPDYNFSNHFIYNENINAAYLNYSKTIKRFSFQAGLRLENTNAKGHQLGNTSQPDSSFVKNYTNLFPTAYLSYKLDTAGTNLLVASFGRRIRRPYYQDLNPFITIADKYSYFSGNPFLRPQYSDVYKLSYNYKSLITAALYYMNTTDLQYEVIRQEDNIFIDGIGNIGTAKYLGASLTISFEPTKWWLSSTFIQIYNSAFRGQLFTTYLDESRTMGEMNMTNIFTLPNGWSAELSGFYVSKRANGQFINDAAGQLNAGIQKKILNNKAAVKFNVRDILNTYTNNGITNNIPNATESFRNKYNYQAFTLGFSYNFGNSANGKTKRNTGSADIEKARVKS